ncbi:hypothetical protein FRC12_009214 [Ceratobasidium sp. 428]|nr:hypothetical protein FRC12_009214 [Ceratobasidium sp. 428]
MLNQASKSLPDIIRILSDHGCRNIASQLDVDSITEFPTHGGGFGDIYQGRMKISRTSVAIKCARHRVEVVADTREMMLVAREVHAWAKCNHENVLALFGMAQHRGRLATVSPWMKNGTLPEYIARNPSVDRLELCHQVASGLAYLHGREMVHGDLKGANVLVSSTGVPKLADFGNMKMKEQSLRFTTRTSTVYSLRWAAPELLNQSPASPEADVYALGMTIYETATGRIPYADMTDMVVAMEIMVHHRTPRWDSDLVEVEHKDGLQRLLNQCWSWESSARPRAADIEFQLHCLREGRGRFAIGEKISFKEFCELKISGGIRQILVYAITVGDLLANKPTGDMILVEFQANDLIMRVHRPWIRLQMGHIWLISGSVDKGLDYIQALPSKEASDVDGRRRVAQLISTNKPVDITHLKRLVCLWSQYPEAPRKDLFCGVIFECMKGLFETAEVENDAFILRVGRSWPRLQDLKAQFLSTRGVDSDGD